MPGRSTQSLGRMSIVIALRRRGQPFEAAELEWVAAARPGLSLSADHLTWVQPSGVEPFTLNITTDELWTDDPRFTTVEHLDVLRGLAKDLRAEVYCEGEPLTDIATAPSAPGKTMLGLLFVVIAAPFIFAWFIITLPWVLWRIKRGVK